MIQFTGAQVARALSNNSLWYNSSFRSALELPPARLWQARGAANLRAAIQAQPETAYGTVTLTVVVTDTPVVELMAAAVIV